MTYYYLLVVAYLLNGQEYEAHIITLNEAHCDAAIRSATPLYRVLEKGLEEPSIHCIPTDVPSGYTIRPKQTPWSN